MLKIDRQKIPGRILSVAYNPVASKNLLTRNLPKSFENLRVLNEQSTEIFFRRS